MAFLQAGARAVAEPSLGRAVRVVLQLAQKAAPSAAELQNECQMLWAKLSGSKVGQPRCHVHRYFVARVRHADTCVRRRLSLHRF